jgi:hypothetical protein
MNDFLILLIILLIITYFIKTHWHYKLLRIDIEGEASNENYLIESSQKQIQYFHLHVESLSLFLINKYYSHSECTKLKKKINKSILIIWFMLFAITINLVVRNL